MSDDSITPDPRPSWLSTPCPPWCTRRHHEDDHHEDRIHQDDGVIVPAMVARISTSDMSRVPVPVELVVQRSQATQGDTTEWVFIGETESGSHLTIAAEAMPRLRAALS